MAVGLLKIGEIKTVQTTLGEISPPHFVFSGSLDTNIYNDITSNKNWMGVGTKSSDYMFCRNQVTMRTAVIGFSALTTEEQVVAAKHFSVAKTDRDTVLTDSEQQEGWTSLIIKTRDSRQLRWTEAKSYISYTLPMSDSIDLGKSTTTLTNEYIVYGVESYEKSGDDGLFDWIGNTSTFSGGTGYNGKSYWVQADQDKMLEILKDGIY